jgi:hypothetical protein
MPEVTKRDVEPRSAGEPSVAILTKGRLRLMNRTALLESTVTSSRRVVGAPHTSRAVDVAVAGNRAPTRHHSAGRVKRVGCNGDGSQR